MSYPADCPACATGNHAEHNASFGSVPGLIGGVHCPCVGDCAERYAAGQSRAFASIGTAGIVHYATCWDCQTMQHPGGLHGWASIDDVKHALATSQPDPSQQRCGCQCADGPVLEVEPIEPDIDVVSLDGEPCPACGSTGACGYDSEGRPLIHALSEKDD